MRSGVGHRVTRRGFLKRAGLVAGAAVGFPAIVPSTVLGAAAPSNMLTMACVGVGGQGSGNMRAFHGSKEVRVIAICDVDSSHCEAAAKAVGLGKEACFVDFREVVGREDIDLVSVGTPDHWHVPVSIAAVRAGKDVYCEKPLTLTIAEGRALADEAARYGRIVQTGSQQRSSSNFRLACELVRNGRIGKITEVTVGIPGNNRTCEPTWEPMPVPPELDYDMWLGPAPWEPYHKQRCHYEFRFLLDYSGGQITNWGAHHLDIAQWGLGMDDSVPVEVLGTGEFPTTGLFTTATKTHFEVVYANGVRLTCATGGSGTRFIGTDGMVYVDRGKLQTTPEALAKDTIGPDEIHLYESNNHIRNFIECVKTRKQPICNAEVGHRSSTLCHLGNIAMLLKRRLQWDPVKEEFVGDRVANGMVARAMRSPWRI